MQQNIKKDYFWNTLGVFAQNAISPLLLIVITRLNGIAHDSGLFSYAFSVAVIFWAIGMWSGRTYQVSDATERFSNRSYIMARIMLGACMLVGALLFSVANRYGLEKSAVIITLVGFKALESVADALYGVLQLHHRLYIAGRSLFYKAVASFGLFVLIDGSTKNLFWSCVGIIIVNVLLIVFYDLRITRKLEDVRITGSNIKRYIREASVIIRQSTPVFIVLFLSMFSLNIPRYFLDMYHQEQIGYFGILAMPITLIGMVMTFILQPRVVHLTEWYTHANYVQFRKTVRTLTLVSLAAGIMVLLITYVIGVPLLSLVFGVNFASYKAALMIVVAGGVVSALVSIFINLLIIMRRFKYQFYTLLLTNVLLAALSGSVVKSHGLLGGVTLFALSSLVQILLLSSVYLSSFKKVKHGIS
jgi:O-antigen/teichoic acid export membrane protein